MLNNTSIIINFDLIFKVTEVKLGVKPPLNYILAQHTVSVYLILTKFGMDILLDPTNKPPQEFLIYSEILDAWWTPGVKGPKSTKFDPTNHISARHLDLAHLIWTKFGMDVN